MVNIFSKRDGQFKLKKVPMTYPVRKEHFIRKKNFLHIFLLLKVLERKVPCMKEIELKKGQFDDI